jgi:hypothetical protein
MRLLLSTMALLAFACTYPTTKAAAEPLVTISCEKPNGINISYGASLQERVEAKEKNQPEPPPTLKEPTKDGYAALPTFIVDSNKKKMTVIWSELREDAEARKVLKDLSLPMIPPPPATDATVVLFTDDQISAIETDLWSIMTYSFFPKLGTAFIGQQAMQPVTKGATELATFAQCQFSWTNPSDQAGKKRP